MYYDDNQTNERWDYAREKDGSPRGFSYAIKVEGKPGTVAWVKKESDARLISQLGSSIQLFEEGRIVAWADNRDVADMISNSREDIPSLLNEREWLLRERERLLDRITQLESLTDNARV